MNTENILHSLKYKESVNYCWSQTVLTEGEKSSYLPQNKEARPS